MPDEANSFTKTPAADPQQTSADSSVLDSLVGEGKPFATIEDLAKSKVESNNFIDQLKEETAGLRKELDTRMTAEEALAEIRKGNTNDTPNPTPEGGATTPQLDRSELAQLVKEALESEKSVSTKQANLDAVESKLTDIYGEDKKVQAIATRAQELGVNVKFLEDIAAASPKAFYETMGLTQTSQSTPSIKTGGVNTEVLDANPGANGGAQPKEGTKAFYDTLKKADTRRYWSPEIQNKMFEDRKRLGDAFYAP